MPAQVARLVVPKIEVEVAAQAVARRRDATAGGDRHRVGAEFAHHGMHQHAILGPDHGRGQQAAVPVGCRQRVFGCDVGLGRRSDDGQPGIRAVRRHVQLGAVLVGGRFKLDDAVVLPDLKRVVRVAHQRDGSELDQHIDIDVHRQRIALLIEADRVGADVVVVAHEVERQGTATRHWQDG